MSKFKVGDIVTVVEVARGDEDVLGKTGAVTAISEGDPIVCTTDIQNNEFLRGYHLAYEHELEFESEVEKEPDTHEYTLENWSTKELLEELLRREKNAD